jgi:hypothetical protein
LTPVQYVTSAVAAIRVEITEIDERLKGAECASA